MALCPPAARAQLPTLGDGLDLTPSAERRVGDRIAREIYRDPDYLDDAVLGEYVQGIWQQLLGAARTRGELPPELDERFAWDVMLIRERSVNAFALPGGYMGVHLGLIATVTSRDELAAVLAHELSHVTQRHISRMLSRQSAQAPWLLGAMILGILAASKNPEAAGAVITGGQAVSAQGQLNFSRDMEREADRIGFGVMAQAGYDPQGAVSMFEKLQKASNLNDTGGFPYLRSHPMTTARIADMQSRQQLQAQTGERMPTMQHALQAARARVLSNPAVDARRAMVAEAASATLKRQPAPRQAGVIYAAALAASGLRDFAQARELADRLHPLVGNDAPGKRLVRLLDVELALACGDIAGARALQDKVDLASRADLFSWAQTMTMSGAAFQAAQQLQTWVSNRPLDAPAWQLLSAAQAAQGHTLRAVRSEAEAYAARLDLLAALNRLRAAQELVRKSAGVDHIEASIIDTRAREIELLMREQALER
jgi:predicted Zn-dependent protease